VKIGDLIKDIRDGSIGVVVKPDGDYEGSNRYYIYWISGMPALIGQETTEYLGSDRKCAYELVTSS
tara:strand:- start:2475 stop:2672 length:198 start_codon:yes stop_codon:yes gene_type:complete